MSRLFSPFAVREVTLRNRVVISPMTQYLAEEGRPTGWHFAHLGAFAMGGAGLVFVESTKVEPRGVGTRGDLCLWSREHAEALRPIASFLREAGARPGIQLSHAGRKARIHRPWEGFGPRQDPRGEPVIGPSALAHGAGWPEPRAMTRADIRDVIEAWAAAARLALDAGFEVVEIHGAHGYLVHQFLSDTSNRRGDAYGGSLANRLRFALELAEAVRAAWPARLPLFFRISATDEVGWGLEDSIALARGLRERGVDVVDCSSGGMGMRSPTAAGQAPGPGYQVPYAARIRRDAGVATMAVGLIVRAQQAEAILQEGSADLVAIGREALYDPYWARHAAQALGEDLDFSGWPPPYGWWLARRNLAPNAG